MQTFVPFLTYKECAQVLDYRRLGKQRVEGCQILSTLVGISEGWKNHPAVKMWAGHEGALAIYTLVMCEEWIRRGYKDTRTEFIHEIYHCELIKPGTSTRPVWWGNPQVHGSHQAQLLKKNWEFYKNSFEDSREEFPTYIWPLGKGAQ